MTNSLDSLCNRFLEMNGQFINGTCRGNFQKMNQDKQREIALTVFLVAVSSGLFAGILASFLNPVLGLLLGVTISAFVAIEAFAYSTFSPNWETRGEWNIGPFHFKGSVATQR